MRKTFDCVEMKWAGAATVQAAVAGLSRAEQLDWWRERERELRQRQEVMRQAKAITQTA